MSESIPRCHGTDCTDPAAYNYRSYHLCLRCFRQVARYTPSMRDVLWFERTEATALWQAVEVLGNTSDFDVYYEGGAWVATRILTNTIAVGDTLAAALIALARRVQGGE